MGQNYSKRLKGFQTKNLFSFTVSQYERKSFMNLLLNKSLNSLILKNPAFQGYCCSYISGPYAR